MGLALGLSGCQGARGPAADPCPLEVGMDTDQLARCGCVSADTRSDYEVPLSPNAARGTVTRVSVVNYMCPLGSAGIAKVVVINGIASEIFY